MIFASRLINRGTNDASAENKMAPAFRQEPFPFVHLILEDCQWYITRLSKTQTAFGGIVDAVDAHAPGSIVIEANTVHAIAVPIANNRCPTSLIRAIIDCYTRAVRIIDIVRQHPEAFFVETDTISAIAIPITRDSLPTRLLVTVIEAVLDISIVVAEDEQTLFIEANRISAIAIPIANHSLPARFSSTEVEAVSGESALAILRRANSPLR
jgi:hypothetical protein